MDAEIFSDERDFEPGGIYYDGPMYVIDDEDDEFDDVPEDD